jgi:XTP/dITP diphosphohydrolase
MKKVFFATTNEGKLKEAREILGIEVIGTPLEIDEIQSLDPLEVAVKKAKEYYQKLKKPIFIEDISFSFSALKGLPGTYINDFLKLLGNEGLIDLLKTKKDRSAFVQATVVYVNEKGKKNIFTGKVEGKISGRPRGEGFGWDPIFIPDGETRTFGEMDLSEKNKYSMRAKALGKLKEWLEKNET